MSQSFGMKMNISEKNYEIYSKIKNMCGKCCLSNNWFGKNKKNNAEEQKLLKSYLEGNTLNVESIEDVSVPSVQLIHKDLLILANEKAYVNDNIMNAAMITIHRNIERGSKVVFLSWLWTHLEETNEAMTYQRLRNCWEKLFEKRFKLDKLESLICPICKGSHWY